MLAMFLGAPTPGRAVKVQTAHSEPTLVEPEPNASTDPEPESEEQKFIRMLEELKNEAYRAEDAAAAKAAPLTLPVPTDYRKPDLSRAALPLVVLFSAAASSCLRRECAVDGDCAPRGPDWVCRTNRCIEGAVPPVDVDAGEGAELPPLPSLQIVSPSEGAVVNGPVPIVLAIDGGFDPGSLRLEVDAGREGASSWAFDADGGVVWEPPEADVVVTLTPTARSMGRAVAGPPVHVVLRNDPPTLWTLSHYRATDHDDVSFQISEEVLGLLDGGVTVEVEGAHPFVLTRYDDPVVGMTFFNVKLDPPAPAPSRIRISISEAVTDVDGNSIAERYRSIEWTKPGMVPRWSRPARSDAPPPLIAFDPQGRTLVGVVEGIDRHLQFYRLATDGGATPLPGVLGAGVTNPSLGRRSTASPTVAFLEVGPAGTSLAVHQFTDGGFRQVGFALPVGPDTGFGLANDERDDAIVALFESTDGGSEVRLVRPGSESWLPASPRLTRSASARGGSLAQWVGPGVAPLVVWRERASDGGGEVVAIAELADGGEWALGGRPLRPTPGSVVASDPTVTFSEDGWPVTVSWLQSRDGGEPTEIAGCATERLTSGCYSQVWVRSAPILGFAQLSHGCGGAYAHLSLAGGTPHATLEEGPFVCGYVGVVPPPRVRAPLPFLTAGAHHGLPSLACRPDGLCFVAAVENAPDGGARFVLHEYVTRVP